MTLQILPKQSTVRSDSGAREVLQYLDANQTRLGLENAIAFYNFPLFREDENLLIAQIVLISPLHGVVMISTANKVPTISEESNDVLTQLEGAFSQVFSRLVKYQKLRKGRAQLGFEIDAILWVPESDVAAAEPVVIGIPALEDYFQTKRSALEIPGVVFSELTSVLDGSKALTGC